MPTFSQRFEPATTVQQLSSTRTAEVGRLGRVVLLTDESYVVDPRDELIVMVATTSAGDYTVTFPDSLPANNRVSLAMVAAPSGSDSYMTDGLASDLVFDAALSLADVLTTSPGAHVAQGVTTTVPPAALNPNSTLGDGTASPSLALDKVGTGAAALKLLNVGLQRGGLTLDSAEDVVLGVYDASEVLLGSITLNHTTGAITLSKGLTVTTGGLTVSAGGATITAGGLTVSAGQLKVVDIVAYADDAAAGVGGLTTGDIYMIGATLTRKT